MEFTDLTRREWLRDERGQLSRRRVVPFRQDWGKAWRWKRDERKTSKGRALYTRWRWPNI
jgi:hypothetical protein